EADRVTMNRDHLLADAKAFALERVREGYQRPVPRTAIPVGGETVLAALKLGVHLAWRAGRITDHDAVVGRALANVIAGGALPHQTTVSEQYLLDLEREAFLKLTGERRRSSGFNTRSRPASRCGTDSDRTRQRSSSRADSRPSGPLGVHAPGGRGAVGV